VLQLFETAVFFLERYSLPGAKEYNAAHEPTSIYWKYRGGDRGGVTDMLGCGIRAQD
jgi:hypothetical protein